MARTIQLVNGDINFDSLGRITWIDDEQRIIQSINLRLKTVRGELFYNEEEYGLEKIRGKITKDILEAYLTDALLVDDEINSVRVVSLDASDSARGQYLASIEITAVIDDELEEITIETLI